MSGIAGILDLEGRRPVPPGVLERMADSLAHRGPDGTAIATEPGVGLICQQLRTAQSDEGERPALCRTDDVLAVLDGALFDGAPLGASGSVSGPELQDPEPVRRGDAHHVASLWKQHGDKIFDQMRGQFAVALYDRRQHRLVLARDRFGISPLHWTRQSGWLLFGSEIKALLGSGMVDARPDLRGVCQVFTLLGVPGPRTCFENISAVVPGHFLDVCRATGDKDAAIRDRVYWQMDFPDRGEEDDGADQKSLLDEYEEVLLRSIGRRLPPSELLAAYSSGGLDSSMLIAMARHLRGEPPSTFTFRIAHPGRNESAGAEVLSEHVGSASGVVDLTGSDLVAAFPGVVRAAESPVIDVSAAALFRLAEAAQAAGFKGVVTGEGADEWQAGYPWYRIHKRLSRAAAIPGLRWDRLAYLAYAKLGYSSRLNAATLRRAEAAFGGSNAWLTVYHLMSTTRLRLFSDQLLQSLVDYSPYEDLELPVERMARWHPINRSAYVGARVHIAGLHLVARGDRAAMHASVQPRYPFLDEEVFAFLARLHPRWKLRGMQDKYLQRMLADRWLPKGLLGGRKRLLHAPLEAFHAAPPPAFVTQLLSRESLARAGYFNPDAVDYWRQRFPAMAHGFRRLFVEMGLVGVISTQLWHHLFFDGNLCELPDSRA